MGLNSLSPRRRLLVAGAVLALAAAVAVAAVLALRPGPDLAGAAAAVDTRLCAGSCAQLVPGSALLARLNRGDETPAGPAFTSIWTASDQTVTPPTSANLRGAVNVRLQDVCADAGVGHGGLVRDPLTLGLVVRALEGALPR